MKSTLTPGIEHKRQIVVDRPRTIDFMGEELRVYATPAMIRDMELTCRELLMGHLEAGEDSVGTRVEVDHLAPALLDSTVEVSAKVLAVEGRKVTFEVGARDRLDELGRGRHVRFVVVKAKSQARIAAKKARLGAG